jgi:thiamine biosynthesis protein ThiS
VGWEELSEAARKADDHPHDILIRLNGNQRRVQAGTTVASLLAERVAVEVDREIVRRADWEGKGLTPGVAVEIVHFVGGG